MWDLGVEVGRGAEGAGKYVDTRIITWFNCPFKIEFLRPGNKFGKIAG
jgi:hypothetical protein